MDAAAGGAAGRVVGGVADAAVSAAADALPAVVAEEAVQKEGIIEI